MFSRRSLLKIIAASQIAHVPLRAQAAESPLKLGPARPFDFDILKALAAQKAKTPYVSPPTPDPEILKQIDYDASNAIRYDLDHALYGKGQGPFPITFLPVGQLFLKSVGMHVIDGDSAREIIFSPDYFTHPADSRWRG